MPELRVSVLDDLPAIADCHAAAFPRALSTSHGRRFVTKMLSWYIVAERGVMFHLEQDGRVVGYCGGIKIPAPGLPGAFTSITQYAYWSFVAAYARKPWLMLHPENLAKTPGLTRNVLLRLGLAKKHAAPQRPEDANFQPAWGLVVIGLRPEFQSHGLGSVLLREFERLASADGAHYVRLSVKRNNVKAIAAYRRNDWFVASESGDALVMRKDLV